MRILYFSRDCTPHDHRFLSSLSKSGHQVFFLRLEKGLHMLEDRPLPGGTEQVEWRGGRGTVTLTGQLLLMRDLRRVIIQVKPDLVLAGPIQRSAFLTALCGFHPLVCMSWGYDLLHDATINPLWYWVTRFTLRHADCLVGDCDTIRSLAIAYGMPNDRIVTFPWGIDINHFTVGKLNRLPREDSSEPEPGASRFDHESGISMSEPISASLSQRATVPALSLLSTRAFEPIYGVDVIARAFVMCAKKIPGIRLTLLGTGTQEAVIRQILLVGGVYDRVEFKGKVGYDDLPHYYQNASLYISASHSDGSSISLLEAFACGTPAIVSDIPGNREWVTPGENGWLFRDGDAIALADAIMQAVNLPQALPGMGQKARLLAEARADWRKNYPSLEKAFQIALNGRLN